MIKKNYILAWVAFSFLTSNVYADQPVIHFAMEATYPPFEYVSSQGEFQGFDLDIAKAVCHEIKRTCQFSNASFASLLPSLSLGKYDALISAISVTPARQKQVAFTENYYEPSGSFVAPLGKTYTQDNVKTAIIGVQEGTTFPKYLIDKYKNQVTMKSYVSIQDAFLDLKSGRVDVVLTDTPIALEWLKQAQNAKAYKIVIGPLIDHEYFGSGFAIAVKKQNTELLNALNQGLNAIKQKGIYQKIYQQYFGGKAVPTPSG